VPVAVENAEEFLPRADGFAILIGHDPADLVQMGEVVSGPGGEKL
jgi:hypothetical protein